MTVVPYARLVRVCAAVAILTGVAVIVGGWVLDSRAMRSLIPGAVGMKAQTAFGLACGGAGLLLLLRRDAGRLRRGTGVVVSALPGVFGLLVLGEYVFGWTLGIDEWPFVDADGRASGIAYPGRFAPTTGVCFALLSLALLTLDAGVGRRLRVSEVIALPIAVVATMSLIGYAYSIPAFYGPASAAKMAVHTAACFVLLAIGILLARPHGHVLRLATTSDPGGMMVRRMIPLATLIPLVLGWLHLRTVGPLFTFEVGTWWLTATTIALLLLMIWWAAAALSHGDRRRRELEGRLYDMANHDQLTGLANRHRFDEELGAFIAYGRRYRRPGAVVLLDLDGFKAINDRRGHIAGDRLLAAVADTVVATVRTTDVVARMGGDEFAIILSEISEGDALAVAGKVVDAIGALSVELDDAPLAVTSSAGVAHIPDFTAVDGERALGAADAAMYEAKAGGGGRALLAAAVTAAA